MLLYIFQLRQMEASLGPWIGNMSLDLKSVPGGAAADSLSQKDHD
jgi:hypothetical protein